MVPKWRFVQMTDKKHFGRINNLILVTLGLFLPKNSLQIDLDWPWA